MVAVLVATAAGASAPNVDVSNLPGPQSETTITIDPSNDQVLLAGSNSFSEGTMRVYSSSDAGRTWQTSTIYPPPASIHARCAADPGVAIDRTGRQYSSFVSSQPCDTGPPRVYVASRASADAPWAIVPVAPLGRARFDDKPWIAVDASRAGPHANRVYAVWSRLSRLGVFSILSSHSDDGGRSWTAPVKVNRTGREETYATVATSRNGTVYVAWQDVTNFAVKISRSTDGGAHFEPERTVAVFVITTIPHCGSGIVIPAQRLVCAQPEPLVSVDTSSGRYAGRVYVTYAATSFQGDQGASVAVFDSRLRLLIGHAAPAGGVAVAPTVPANRADQFFPEAAVDPSSGALWICFYDTSGDLERKKTFYSCTASTNGGKSFAPLVRAASVASDETVADADPREYGDYEGLAVAGGVAHPIWTDSRDLLERQEEVYTTTLTLADLHR
jgi:hypothetical protein